MLKQKHTYMISKWFGVKSDGTACLLRTDDEAKFWREVRNIRETYNINEENARIVYHPNMTIFSFASTPSGNVAMQMYPVLSSNSRVERFGSMVESLVSA